jgi:hypothetical protein
MDLEGRASVGPKREVRRSASAAEGSGFSREASAKGCETLAPERGTKPNSASGAEAHGLPPDTAGLKPGPPTSEFDLVKIQRSPHAGSKALVAAWIVGERSADEHGAEEPAALGDLGQDRIALHRVGADSVRRVQRIARGHDVARPLGQI